MLRRSLLVIPWSDVKEHFQGNLKHRRLHHIEIISGKNGHTVRHFHTVNDGGTAAYRSETHVFGNVKDVAQHIEDVLGKHEEENEPKRATKAEAP